MQQMVAWAVVDRDHQHLVRQMSSRAAEGRHSVHLAREGQIWESVDNIRAASSGNVTTASCVGHSGTMGRTTVGLGSQTVAQDEVVVAGNLDLAEDLAVPALDPDQG